MKKKILKCLRGIFCIVRDAKFRRADNEVSDHTAWMRMLTDFSLGAREKVRTFSQIASHRLYHLRVPFVVCRCWPVPALQMFFSNIWTLKLRPICYIYVLILKYKEKYSTITFTIHCATN